MSLPTFDVNPSAEPVPVKIGKREFFLFYSIRTLRKMKRELNTPMMGLHSGILQLDESILPEIITLGACAGKDENERAIPLDPPLTVDEIEDLPAASFAKLIQAFQTAFTGQLPKELRPAESTETATPAKTA